MIFTVHYEATITVDEDTFEDARERANEIIYGGANLEEHETVERGITMIEDEEGREEDSDEPEWQRRPDSHT